MPSSSILLRKGVLAPGKHHDFGFHGMERQHIQCSLKMRLAFLQQHLLAGQILALVQLQRKQTAATVAGFYASSARSLSLCNSRARNKAQAFRAVLMPGSQLFSKES